MSPVATRPIPLVFFDANVFSPVRLADLVLSCVGDGLFDLCVSDPPLDEIERVLVDDKGLPEEKSAAFRAAVRTSAFHGSITKPDNFFAQLIVDGFGDDLMTAISRMSARLTRPHRTPSEIVDGLEQIGLVITAERLRKV